MGFDMELVVAFHITLHIQLRPPKNAFHSGYMLVQRATCIEPFLSIAVRKSIGHVWISYQVLRTMVRHVICIDEVYVPTASLEARMLPSLALGHDLRERWGWNRCKRCRDGHRVACSGRNRDTRHVAIYGRIRWVGSVSHFFGEYL